MNAAVFYAPHMPVSIEELELQGLANTEVLVEIAAAGVCHSDYLISHYRPLDEVNEAFEDLSQGKVARTVLLFG